jgi:hypothetical protein
MTTSCPRCEGIGCSYCSGIGRIDYADYDVGYDRELRKVFKEVTRLKILLSRAQTCISGCMLADSSGYVLENDEAIQKLMDDITTVLVSWK